MTQMIWKSSDFVVLKITFIQKLSWLSFLAFFFIRFNEVKINHLDQLMFFRESKQLSDYIGLNIDMN